MEMSGWMGKTCRLRDIPNFGGDRPDGDLVLSWDEIHMIVLHLGSERLLIVPRDNRPNGQGER
jgi:hypothetical protein